MQSPVTFDSRCYFVNGEPVWLASGEINYFKLTRGDWRRRLLQMKLAGFNTVSVYMPWNYHEPEEGVWDFKGERDVGYFLKLAAELGLFVIARPGPFICDEWQCGGLPPWLSVKKGIRLRTADPLYLHYCDLWWDKIVPILAKYQLGKEGSVILVQVENEYGHMGEHQESGYIYHLRDGLLRGGINVPVINCDSFIRFARLKPMKWDGINLCCNFGGDAIRNLERARLLQPDAPLMVTEYWISAFDYWGREGSAVYGDKKSLYGALEIVAGGAAGLNVFVFSGGAHFGYWHGCSICSDDNFMTTLYGPGAPILDDGLLSRKYYLFKSHFTGLMSGMAALATATGPTIVQKGKNLLQSTLRSGKTEYSFYINRSPDQIRIADAEKEQAAVDMSIPAGAVSWSVRNLSLAAGFWLETSSAAVFACDPALVLYAPEGEKTRTKLLCPEKTTVVNCEGFTITGSGRQVLLEAGAPASEPCRCTLASAGRRMQVLLLSRAAVERCWRVALPGMRPLIVGGPDRIEDVVMAGRGVTLKLSARVPRKCWRVTAGGFQKFEPAFSGQTQPFEVSCRDGCASADFGEARLDFDDSGWFAAEQPQAMAKFSNGQGRAWYRVGFTVTAGGPHTICFSGAADRALVFVDGSFVNVRGSHSHFGWNVMIALRPGRHLLAILVENLGMMNSGAEMDIPLGEPKGIYGPVWLDGEEMRGWKMRGGLRAGEHPDDWPEVETGFEAAQNWPAGFADGPVKGPVWFRTQFDAPAGFDGAVRLHLKGAAVKGSVWLNGRNVGRYWNIGPQDSLWLPLSLIQPHNVLVFFEELELRPAKIRVTFQPFGLTADYTVSD